MIALGVVVLLLCANGLFVAAELSLVALPRARVERRAAEGDPRAREVLRLLDDPCRRDRYLATAQLGVTAVSLGLGMYGEHALAASAARGLQALGLSAEHAAPGLASGLALVAFTALHAVLGEMVPKSLALAATARTSVALVARLGALERALAPLVSALDALSAAALAALGVSRAAGRDRLHGPGELRLLVRDSGARGLLAREAAAVVEGLLALTGRTAREVMVPRVRIDGLALDAAAAELARAVAARPRTRYPVYRGDLDHVVGGVHLKALLPRLRAGLPLAPPDVRPLPCVSETASLEEVLGTLRAARAHLALVRDAHGGTAGLITLADLYAVVLGPHEAGDAACADRPPTLGVPGRDAPPR